jgi:GNAT superfamily N-acetyltransferase
MLEMTDKEWEDATWLHDPAEVEKLEHKYNSPAEARALAYVQKLKGITKVGAVTKIDPAIFSSYKNPLLTITAPKTAASDEEERAEALKYTDENAFLKHHYTGQVPSSAYSGERMFSWQKPEKYPKLLKTVTLKDGQQVDLRQEGSKNEYLKTKEVMVKNTAGYDVPYHEHVRDEKGDLVYLSDEEAKAKNLPLYDTAIMAFNKEGQCVAQASDEWGADLVAVREDYQKKGLGTIMLTEFRRQFHGVRQMGQMTPAGTNLAKSYYRSLTGKEPQPVEDIEQNPDYQARRAIWRFYGNLEWTDWNKFTPEQATKLREIEKKFEERNSDVHEVLKELQEWVKTQPQGTFSQNSLNALANNPEGESNEI